MPDRIPGDFSEFFMDSDLPLSGVMWHKDKRVAQIICHKLNHMERWCTPNPKGSTHPKNQNLRSPFELRRDKRAKRQENAIQNRDDGGPNNLFGG